MLFLNAVGEVYQRDKDLNGQKRFNECRSLMLKFVPFTPMKLMYMIAGGTMMSSPEMNRISSCYTMFGDLDKAFRTFLKEVHMQELEKKYGIRIKENHSIIEPWPLKITELATKEEFEIRCASMRTGCERYLEFEKL